MIYCVWLAVHECLFFVQQCGRKMVLKLMEFPAWLLVVQHGDKKSELGFYETIVLGRTNYHEMTQRKNCSI